MKKIKLTYITFLMMTVYASASSIEIKNKFISFSKWRKAHTLKYIQEHYDINATSIEIKPKMIVIHYTATGSFQSTWSYLNRESIYSNRSIKSAGSVNVSSHFLVKRNGSIYRLMPETTMARHVIGLNHIAIGIENIGSSKNPLTLKQLKANVKLVRYLKKKYNIEYLIGHSEYRKFENSPLWKEKDKTYRTIKSDPGKKFMKKLRYYTKNLNLSSHPQTD